MTKIPAIYFRRILFSCSKSYNDNRCWKALRNVIFSELVKIVEYKLLMPECLFILVDLTKFMNSVNIKFFWIWRNLNFIVNTRQTKNSYCFYAGQPQNWIHARVHILKLDRTLRKHLYYINVLDNWIVTGACSGILKKMEKVELPMRKNIMFW